MALINLTSSKEFTNFIQSDYLSIIHFYAPWVDQCNHINTLLEQIAKSSVYKNIKTANIIAEDLPEISIKYDISAVPTILAFKSNNIVCRIDGFNPIELNELINKQSLNFEYFRDKLKKLINKYPCILFMKGSREVPRCGFSKAIINLLDKFKADYETFDILEDNEVREGLKKYSNWPTYPQLYVNGELIGGLDIVKDMSESGDLDNILPKKSI